MYHIIVSIHSILFSFSTLFFSNNSNENSKVRTVRKLCYKEAMEGEKSYAQTLLSRNENT